MCSLLISSQLHNLHMTTTMRFFDNIRTAISKRQIPLHGHGPDRARSDQTKSADLSVTRVFNKLWSGPASGICSKRNSVGSGVYKTNLPSKNVQNVLTLCPSPFARIDCLSLPILTRHKNSKFAKNMLYRYKLPTTWRYMTYY